MHGELRLSYAQVTMSERDGDHNTSITVFTDRKFAQNGNVTISLMVHGDKGYAPNGSKRIELPLKELVDLPSCKTCGSLLHGLNDDRIDCGGDCSKCVRDAERQAKKTEGTVEEISPKEDDSTDRKRSKNPKKTKKTTRKKATKKKTRKKAPK